MKKLLITCVAIGGFMFVNNSQTEAGHGRNRVRRNTQSYNYSYAPNYSNRFNRSYGIDNRNQYGSSRYGYGRRNGNYGNRFGHGYRSNNVGRGYANHGNSIGHGISDFLHEYDHHYSEHHGHH